MEGDIIKIRRDYKRTNLCWSEKKNVKTVCPRKSIIAFAVLFYYLLLPYWLIFCVVPCITKGKSLSCVDFFPVICQLWLQQLHKFGKSLIIQNVPPQTEDAVLTTQRERFCPKEEKKSKLWQKNECSSRHNAVLTTHFLQKSRNKL